MQTRAQEYLNTVIEKIRLIRSTEKGEVWLASDRRTGRLVILKRVSLAGLPYAKLMKISHQLWPKIFYCMEKDNETIVVEEFVQGESLAERLEEKRWLSENEAREIMLRLCEGLAILHENGIIHRDIKPSNLILQPGNIIRLIDFDAARIMKETGEGDTIPLGTKGYAPPEQYGYGQTDARSDIFSVGVTMKNLMGKDYDGTLLVVTAKCMELDPARRYASADELRRDILYPPRRKKIRAAVCVSLAALFAGGLLYFYAPEKSEKPAAPAQVPSAAKSAGAPAADVPAEPQREPQLNDEQNGKNAPEPPMQPAEQPTNQPAAQSRANEEPEPDNEATTRGTAQNIIYVAAYLNNVRLGAWADNTDIRWGEYMEFTAQTWERWIQPDGSARFPADWQLRLHVENRSSETWRHSSLTVSFDDHGRVVTNRFKGGAIAAGESMEFAVPLGGYRISEPLVQYPMRDFHLQLSGSGPQIVHGASGIFSVSLVPRGGMLLDEIIRQQEERAKLR